jgi:16S rRNA (adenine1518-N6/adenine1519-N6)-dimethyltransferase
VNHSSISDIRSLLETEGIALKKRFGQNFLVDDNVRRRIADLAIEMYNREGEGELWEVGPGIGSITDLLVETAIPLRLFEIDHGIIGILRRRYGNTPPIEEGDFIETGVSAFRRGNVPAMICGNLPYAAASSIIARIIETPIPVRTMAFMVQTELADRLRAKVGTKDYSALSVLVQNHYATTVAFHVSGGAFFPRPQVGSTVIVMEESGSLSPETRRTTSRVARTAFSQRRKALRNSLREYAEAMEIAGIDAGLRPENLTPADFVSIAKASMRGSTPS